MLGLVHVMVATAALTLGALVLAQQKGGARHRLFGFLYSAALLSVNLSALTVYDESGTVGPFHVLALISLATLAAGFLPAYLRRPKSSWMSLHAYFMSWSYVGLVAAGVAQLVTQLSALPGMIAVGVPSMVVVIGGGLLIHTRVPEILAVLASRRLRRNRWGDLTRACS